MNVCPGCGGVVGRDCFNVPECIQISERMRLQEMFDHLAENDVHFICQALNFYWNDALYHLTEIKSLGDIERQNYQHQLDRSKEIMFKLGMQ